MYIYNTLYIYIFTLLYTTMYCTVYIAGGGCLLWIILIAKKKFNFNLKIVDKLTKNGL